MIQNEHASTISDASGSTPPTNHPGSLTRRQFIASATAGAVGTITAGAVGYTVTHSKASAEETGTGATEVEEDQRSSDNPTVRKHVDVVPATSQWAMPAYVDKPDEVLTYDMVCVGSGLGGFSAGLTALQEGVKSVAVVERSDALGGNTAMAEGLTAIDTDLLKEAGFEDLNPDIIIQKEFDWHHYICDATLWSTVLRNNPDDINWLMDQGVKLVACVATGGADYPTHHIYEGHRGTSAIKALNERFVEAGGTVLTNTRVTHMLMDDNTVAGVQCITREGKVINIACKAVVLATGGAGANKDIVDLWTERNSDNQSWLGSPYITGDGIMLAVEAGMGKPYHLGGPGLGARVEPLDLASHFNCAAALESCDLWVNQDGRRFFNEGVTLSFYAPVNAIESQCFTYSVFDQGVMDHYVNDGADVGWAQYVKKGTLLTNAPDEVDREIRLGNPYVFKADTLEELADQIGFDDEAKQTFLDTVEEYNGFCRDGNDAKFFKDPYYLRELKTPPFYGARLKAGVVSQKGGVHCNCKAEVIKMTGKRINGLYVTGLDCGGFQSQTTGITIPGSVQGYALGMGRLSGKNGAAYILGNE